MQTTEAFHAPACPEKAAWPSERWLMVGLVAVAFGLRVFRSGTQSLWGDEAFSVFRALDSLAEITARVPAEGTLPPLYYYLLHFWVSVAGTTETAVRFVSVIFGTLAIPLLYLLVRRTLGPRVGAAASILATLSPFWIYYAQETRTYALVTAMLILALYLLLRAGDNRSPGESPGAVWLWGGYAVAAALAMYSYYFAGFALAAATIWLLAERRRWPRLAIRCILAQVGALLLLAPLLIYSFSGLVGATKSVDRGANGLPLILDHLTLAFNFGMTVPRGQVEPFIVVALVLAGLGLIASPWRVSILWGLLLVVPVLAIYGVSFVPHNGWERYFMTATPAWYALVAAGIEALVPGRPSGTRREARRKPDRSRRRAALGLVVAGLASACLLAGIVPSLANYYFNPAYWRYDFRSAVQQVEIPATPDVAVVVNGEWGFPSFFYYFRELIPDAQLPAPYTSEAQTDARLASLTSRYRGIWLVTRHPEDDDPTRTVQVWLDENAYEQRTWWVENATFTFYLTEDPAAPDVVGADPVGQTFGADAKLTAYRASVAQSQDATYLLVTLTWRALRTPTEDLKVFAHLVAANGDRLAQSNHRPVAEIRPAGTWHAGDVLQDRFALKLPARSVGQGLRLEVGLFAPDGQRLPIQGVSPPEDTLTLPLPGLNPVPPHQVLTRDLGTGVRLLGYQLAPDPVQPGDTLTLTLYWQRRGPINGNYTVFAHLLGPGQRIVAQEDSPPVGGRRPTSTWLPGEVLADHYELAIPPGTPAGADQVEVGMYDPRTGQRLPVVADPATGSGGLRATSGDRVLLPESVRVVPPR